MLRYMNIWYCSVWLEMSHRLYFDVTITSCWMLHFIDFSMLQQTVRCFDRWFLMLQERNWDVSLRCVWCCSNWWFVLFMIKDVSPPLFRCCSNQILYVAPHYFPMLQQQTEILQIDDLSCCSNKTEMFHYNVWCCSDKWFLLWFEMFRLFLC